MKRAKSVAQLNAAPDADHAAGFPSAVLFSRAVGAGERQAVSRLMEHPRQIPESDWKVWRELQKIALERFCQKALNDFAKFKDGDGSAHERYIKLYQLVKRRDKKLGEIFDGPSRSNALIQISLAVRARLVTTEELSRFSEGTRDRVAFLAGQDG